MKKKIILKNRKIEYDIRKSRRARRMRLAIYCDGNFVVTIPQTFSEKLVEKFIRKKVEWILEKMEDFKNSPKFNKLKGNKRDYLEYKGEALYLVTKRIAYFNEIYKFRYNRINIKNQKTRWGSCSKKGNLNFNYKIVHLPKKVADYIIVHEMCHLKEFNHSKKFWKLVGKTIPNYLKVTKEIN